MESRTLSLILLLCCVLAASVSGGGSVNLRPASVIEDVTIVHNPYAGQKPEPAIAKYLSFPSFDPLVPATSR
jgi:hypothetical protein